MDERRTAHRDLAEAEERESVLRDYHAKRGTRLSDGYITVTPPIIPELERFDWRQECRWKEKRRCA